MIETTITLTPKGIEKASTLEVHEALSKVGAYPPEGLREIAYQRLQDFVGDRLRLKHRYGGLPELLNVSESRWNIFRHLHNVRVPYSDHPRLFIDKLTKERVLVIQPYFPCFERKEETSQGQEHERECERAFWNKYRHGTFQLIEDRDESNPQEPLWRQAVAEVLERVNDRSQAFAHAFDLTVEVSMDRSWYYPGCSILIAYRSGISN